jgi:uncharacterized protein YndB with AHSA1/START domain
MATEVQLQPNNDRELVLARVLDASPEALYRCWTDPELIPKWFTPRPWTTEVVRLDLKPGGASRFTMRGPDGEVFPNDGVFLELEPGRKVVFTDNYTEGWVPNPDPMMTAVITFEARPDGKTLYTARVGHPSAEKKAQHEAMGFHGGWGICAEQLEEVAKTVC